MDEGLCVLTASVSTPDVCGVDMLRSNHGPVIMEVNSSPGLEGIESATGKDVAGMIIDFIAANDAYAPGMQKVDFLRLIAARSEHHSMCCTHLRPWHAQSLRLRP